MLGRIQDMLFPTRADESALRAVSESGFLARLAPRLANVTRPGTVVLLPFHEPSVRSAIHEAKYHGSARAQELLALALADYLRDADAGFAGPPLVIVPVPLGKARRKERGFNQVEEVVRGALREIGREAAGPFQLAPGLLLRTRETVSQVALPRREREENMRGAFASTHPLDPAGTYLVVDDVLTTGATLQAAIDALRDAGAVHIIPLALAH